MIKMKIAVSMIVKNESSCLETCLKSIQGVDEIVIVDTGSEDNTVEIAKQYTDKVYSGEEYKWRDSFQHSRNQSLNLVSKDMDYILFIDADEELEPNGIRKIRDLLSKIPREINVINVYCKDKKAGQIHKSVRLIKNNEGIYWCGDIHNYLSERGQIDLDIVIEYGYSEAHKKDPDRALRILSKVVSENPNCVREKYYLAREYWYRNNYDTAIKWFEKYLVVATWAPEKADAYIYLARCYWAKREFTIAKRACYEAIIINHNFKEAWLLLSQLNFEPQHSFYAEIAQKADNSDVLFIRT